MESYNMERGHLIQQICTDDSVSEFSKFNPIVSCPNFNRLVPDSTSQPNARVNLHWPVNFAIHVFVGTWSIAAGEGSLGEGGVCRIVWKLNTDTTGHWKLELNYSQSCIGYITMSHASFHALCCPCLLHWLSPLVLKGAASLWPIHIMYVLHGPRVSAGWAEHELDYHFTGQCQSWAFMTCVLGGWRRVDV